MLEGGRRFPSRIPELGRPAIELGDQILQVRRERSRSFVRAKRSHGSSENCTLVKALEIDFARALASVVFPTPGTSSMRIWLPARALSGGRRSPPAFQESRDPVAPEVAKPRASGTLSTCGRPRMTMSGPEAGLLIVEGLSRVLSISVAGGKGARQPPPDGSPSGRVHSPSSSEDRRLRPSSRHCEPEPVAVVSELDSKRPHTGFEFKAFTSMLTGT